MSVDLPDGTLIEHIIDGRNRRIGKQVTPPGGAPQLVRKWLYKDGLNPVYEEAWDSASSTWVQTRFVYASRANVPDFVIRDNVTYRIIVDHLGSPRLVINTTNGLVEQALEYDEWGNVLSDTFTGAIPLHPFSFAGGLYDADTKLVRFGARDYDSQTGRWTSKDLIRFSGDGANLYGYVDSVGKGLVQTNFYGYTDSVGKGLVQTNFYGYTANDPVNFIDTTGLAVGDWWDLPANFKRAWQIGEEELAKRPNSHNDLGDALRHAEWMRRTTQETNIFTAWVAGTGHEIESLFLGQPISETLMDLHNNAVGRNAGNNNIPVDPNLLWTLPLDESQYNPYKGICGK